MFGSSVFPEKEVISEWLVLQYFQIHDLSQNGWSFSRMLGPSVFPDSQVIPEWLVLQYFQIHESYQNAWSFSISRFTGDTRMLGLSEFPASGVLKMFGPPMPKV